MKGETTLKQLLFYYFVEKMKKNLIDKSVLT